MAMGLLRQVIIYLSKASFIWLKEDETGEALYICLADS